MKAGILNLGAVVGLPLVIGLVGVQADQSSLGSAELKTMIGGMGYETKDLGTEPGKEKYEFVVKTSGFNIPVGAEITPSKNYIWLTANLGSVSEKTKWEELLRANGVVQPTQFYATKGGALMVGLPIENRGVTPAWMRKCIDKIAADVEKQATVWQSGE